MAPQAATKSRPGPVRPDELRRVLHDANDELSIALLQLELLAEGAAGDVSSDTAGLQEALVAAGRAADRLRQAWRLLDEGEDSAPKPG